MNHVQNLRDKLLFEITVLINLYSFTMLLANINNTFKQSDNLSSWLYESCGLCLPSHETADLLISVLWCQSTGHEHDALECMKVAQDITCFVVSQSQPASL